MKTLVANLMSEVLEVILWLNIIVCAIIGYKTGDTMNHHYLVGAILGILVGFVLNVLEGGIFLLLMEIRNDLKEVKEINDTIKDHLWEIKKVTGGNETAAPTSIPTKNEVSDTKKVNIDMDSLLRK